MRVLVLTFCIGLVAGVPAFAQVPPPDDAPAPHVALAGEFAATATAMRAAVDGWRAAGGALPAEAVALAERQQRISQRLAKRPALLRKVLAGLGPVNRRDLRDDAMAKRELASIHSVVVQRPAIRIGRAQPADELRAHYRRAWRRFRVAWRVLAAVNFVESRFGRLRNESVSGARGPMQFMPATWAAYGLGGNVRDPRDAILGAANYLHANGAPGDYPRALYRYNPSSAYVSAVQRYAAMIERDERAFYALYARPVVLQTGHSRKATAPAAK